MDQLKSRQEAIRWGLKHYLGRPCKTCGGCKRYVLGSSCCACSVRKSREGYQRLREALKGKGAP